MTLAATVFVTLTFGAIGFQIALVAGAPWGHLAWGGQHAGTLPPRFRAGSVVSALLLSLFAAIVAARAGLILPAWHDASTVAVWGVVGYCALGVLANAATPSRAERNLWLPVVTLMLVSSAIVALGPGHS